MYCAYVTRIHNLRKHTNADRLLCGECFGNTVIVDLGTDPDQLGVYFPTDGKLGLEFAQKNDLLRRKDENGAPAGGYLDPEKRNIKALKLRGEKSDGLFLPLSCLASFTDIKKLQEGDTISVLNGITICEKYVPAVKRASGSGGGGNHVRKRSDPISPLFQEHADTEQLAYNLSAFHAGDLVEVTLKMHGTSQRTGYLLVLQGYKYRNRMEKRLYESRKTLNVIRSKIKRTPIYDWGYVTGTRRVVLDTFDEGGYVWENCVSNLRRSGSCHRSTEGRQRVMTNYENLKAAAQSLGDFCDNHEDCDGCTLSALCECMPAALPKLINAIAENKEKSGGKK